jgi:CheY-like chemotaxis protein
VETGPAIYIANGDADEREMLASILTTLPASIRAFGDLGSLVAALDRAPAYDAVILDLDLPDVDGWRAADLL